MSTREPVIQEDENHQVAIHQYHGKKWSPSSCTTSQLLQKYSSDSESLHATFSIIFFPTPKTKGEKPGPTPKVSHDVGRRLSAVFGIPQAFWSDLHVKASGYFSAEELGPASEDDSSCPTYATTFRFLLKRVDDLSSLASQGAQKSVSDNKYDGSVGYHWQELGFFSKWIPDSKSPHDNGTLTVLCFGVPSYIQERIQNATHLENEKRSFMRPSPFALHGLILEQLVIAFDEALWKCRDLIRDLERLRPKVEAPKIPYIRMHEIARHVIHSSESLDVASAVVESMMDEFRNNCSTMQSPRESTAILRALAAQKSFLRCLLLRSRALESRLSNEMNFAFHVTTQHDSKTSSSIAKATQQDSTSMRTISALGLLFLPATFISSIFSMSFFHVDSPADGGPDQWVMASQFWIYWVVAIPVTAMTIIAWYFWQTSPVFTEENTTTATTTKMELVKAKMKDEESQMDEEVYSGPWKPFPWSRR